MYSHTRERPKEWHQGPGPIACVGLCRAEDHHKAHTSAKASISRAVKKQIFLRWHLDENEDDDDDDDEGKDCYADYSNDE